MSSIDELKDNNVTKIDLTQSHDEGNKVDMSTGRKPVQHNSTRQSFDPKSIEPQKVEEEQPTVLESILEGPDSMLGQYIERKTAEMEERLSTFEEEKEEVEASVFEKEQEDNGVNMSSLISGEDSGTGEYVSEDVASYDIDTEDIDLAPTLNTDDDYRNEEAKVSKEVETPDIDVQVTTLDGEVGNTTNDDEEDGVENEADSEESADESEETLKHLQALATEKIKPISKTLDISSFTIAKKASTNSNLLKKPHQKASKWVLMDQEIVVFMKEFTGAELQALQEYTMNSRSLSALSSRYRMIYDHILSPKPDSFEAWLKVTPLADIDNYFFAIYIASYKGANYLPKDCKDPKCKETYLTENIDIMSMVKFKSDEIKNKFMQLYHDETVVSNKNGIYISEVVPVSENLAVSFRSSSIYSLFEYSSLDDKFRDKCADIIEFIPYIDTIYTIDQVNQTLIPVGYKTYPENATKTVKSKIKKFAECLRTLTSDEFSLIKSYANEIRKKEDAGLSYVYPATTCPKCGKEDEEIAVRAEEAVFTRYQLGALVNTSLN